MKLTFRETVICDRKNKSCDLCNKRIETGEPYIRLYWHDCGYTGITVAHPECAKNEAIKRRS